MKDYSLRIDEQGLRALDANRQKEVMRQWFLENYEDPINETPYDSEDGEYRWFQGGPYEADNELNEQFGGVVSEEVIAELASELDAECAEWAPKSNFDVYSEEFFDAVASNPSAAATFEKAAESVRELLKLATANVALCRLLYANVITALETYLSDRFINLVLQDDQWLERFVEKNKNFERRSIPYSTVFREVADAKNKVKAYLLDVVWHNVAKVQAMYKSVFGVRFGKDIKEVAPAIGVRHDIVHRNGVDKLGNAVDVSPEDVQRLLEAVERLIRQLDNDVSKATEPPF